MGRAWGPGWNFRRCLRQRFTDPICDDVDKPDELVETVDLQDMAVGWLRRHAPQLFNVHCAYTNRKNENAVGAQLSGNFSRFKPIGGLTIGHNNQDARNTSRCCAGPVHGAQHLIPDEFKAERYLRHAGIVRDVRENGLSEAVVTPVGVEGEANVGLCVKGCNSDPGPVWA